MCGVSNYEDAKVCGWKSVNGEVKSKLGIELDYPKVAGLYQSILTPTITRVIYLSLAIITSSESQRTTYNRANYQQANGRKTSIQFPPPKRTLIPHFI
jgi:hypothetical protein